MPERKIQYYTEAEKDRTVSDETKPVSAKDAVSEAGTLSPCDTVPAVENTASVFDGLRRIGMNVELGLNYCYGAEDFYTEMLQMYYEQSAGKRSEIVALYESEDWAGYAIKVHALKSTSLTIGAEKLSEQAKALELAGKSGDTDYIRENHQTMLQSYEAVCSCIADSIGIAGRGEEKAL